jgi:hypothetical protein
MMDSARAALPAEIVVTYVDHAVSGRQERRPQLQALMRAARRHAFACVLVWKFDRFARSVTHLLRALEEFDYLGIRFISVQDQVDTASPMGKALFTIIGAMAELESALISERVNAGMAAARARGKRLGRPATPAPLVAHIEEFAATSNIRQIHTASGVRQPVCDGCDRQTCPSPDATRGLVRPFCTYPYPMHDVALLSVRRLSRAKTCVARVQEEQAAIRWCPATSILCPVKLAFM